MEKKIWLITGCSTGFGRELAKIVASNGEFVVGTVRKESQIADLEALHPDLVKGILLDVQNQEQIDSAKLMVEKEFGRLDVLVNNAGYGALGSIEETPDVEIQRQFDVNVFGAVRMIKLALPFMRRQKSGYIINITSIAGINGNPGVGIYNGSKFALEGIGEALAKEVAHLGIKVINVEPGPFRTDWAGRSASYTDSKIEDYAESAGKNLQNLKDISGQQVGDPVRGSRAIYQLTHLEKPPVHFPIGAIAYRVVNKKADTLKEEVAAFEYLGKATDYTEEELKEMDS